MTNLPIAVLISGAGSTLQNLIHSKNAGQLPVDFKLVISDRPAAAGLQFAKEMSIPIEVVSRTDYPDHAAFSEQVFSLCRAADVRLVVMGGFLAHVSIAVDFENRVINIHPSLIPAFCGKGFYGLRVHQAALDYGVRLSGCTVHFVDNEYDHGPIIAQRACPIFPEDTPESLRGRVAELERALYPEVITAIARDLISVDGRKVVFQNIV